MRLRYRIWLGTLLLGLTSQLGCVTFKDWNGSSMTGASMEGTKAATVLPDPEAAKLCMAAAAKFEDTCHFDEAAVQLEKARAHNPKQDVTHRLALLYEEMGKYPQALAEYNKELAVKPRDANLLNDIGFCLYKKGDWTESERQLRQALALSPLHKYAWGNLGQVLAVQGRIDESLAAFQHSVDLPAAHCNVAFVLASHGKFAEARLTYKKVLELDPQNKKAQSALADLYKIEKKEAAKDAAKPAATAAAPTAGGYCSTQK